MPLFAGRGAVALLAEHSDEPPPIVVADPAPPPVPPAPAPEPPDEPAEEESETTKEEHPLDQVVSVEFDDVDLSNVLQFVSDSTGIPFKYAGDQDRVVTSHSPLREMSGRGYIGQQLGRLRNRICGSRWNTR